MARPQAQSSVTAAQFQTELTESCERDDILLVEIYSRWCGPCQVFRPELHRLLQEKGYPCEVRAVSVDIDRVIKDLRVNNSAINWWPGDDDTSPARWSRILLPWVGTIEPTFLYFRRGHLCTITEGLNLPQVEFHLEWLSQPDLDVDNIRIGITQKEINAAAYVIQVKWRRKQQLKRIGVYVNGMFRTHSEVHRERELMRIEQEKQEHERIRFEAAVKIQKIMRGFLARRWYTTNKKQLLQRHRIMRKGNAQKKK